MFELKISAANATELVEQVEGLRAALMSSTTTQPVPSMAEQLRTALDKPKATRARKEPEAKVEVAPEPEIVAPDGGEPEGAGAITYPDVQKAVTTLAASKGRDAVIAVLDTFGVDHGKKLAEDQWPEAIAALTSALEG